MHLPRFLPKPLLIVAFCLSLAFSAYLIATKQQRLDYRLYTAIQKWDNEEALAALAEGSNPNALIPDGISGQPLPLLVHAIENDRPGFAQLLIEHGADVKAGESVRRPILEFAIQRGHTALVALLLEKGMSPHGKSAVPGRGRLNELSPLMVAVRNNRPDIVHLLLQKGADVNFQMVEAGSRGDTALMLAARTDPKLVTILLQAGADPAISDVWKRTALDIAKAAKQDEAVKILNQRHERKKATGAGGMSSASSFKASVGA